MANSLNLLSFRKYLLNILENILIGPVNQILKSIEFSGESVQKSNKMLKNIKIYAQKNTLYYSKYQNLLVTKKILQFQRSQFLSNRHPLGQYINSSGGSTGMPVSLVQDREYRTWCRATEKYYFKNFLGIDIDQTLKIVLWGSERDSLKQSDLLGKIYNWLSNTVFLNSFNISQVQMAEYVRIINLTKPIFIKGYAGSLFELAQFIKEKHLKITRIQFIYSAAEQLRDFMRKEIESVFKCKVYNFYGSREVGPIAGECHLGTMHIFNFHNYIEIYDFKKDQPIKANHEGRIIISNLHNYSMPLIKYEIGDTGSILSTMCKCGSRLPILKNITGRITDHFLNSRGDIIHGEFFTHLFYYRDWIKQFQVIQYAINKIKINYVCNTMPKYSDISDIESKIRKVMGLDCIIEWVNVDNIQTEGQGKFRYTISQL